MIVQGHPDSQATAATYQELSQRRAKAIRDYLVTRGIASDRIRAPGFGPTQSIADNESPEGHIEAKVRIIRNVAGAELDDSYVGIVSQPAF